MIKQLKVDFMSMAGSYMAITKRTDEELINSDYFMLRSLHGMSKNKNCWDVCEFIPQFEFPMKLNEIDYFKSEMSTGKEKLRITFADKDCLLVHVKECRFCIDFKFKSKSDYLLKLFDGSYVYNSYKTSTKYIISFDNIEQLSIEKDKINLYADDGYVYMKETASNIDVPFDQALNFDQAEKKMRDTFLEFSQTFKKNETWKDTLEYAQYVIWSSIVSPRWMIKNELIVTSNYKFTCAWGFDNLLMLIGLMDSHPNLAKKQIKNFIDAQDELGMVPGSIDDATYRFNFAKPPVQGVFLKKVLKGSDLSRREKKEIYIFLDRLTRYWLDKKDSNKDGICEYLHGNESCQDNSTQFDDHALVDSAELYGYILSDLDVLVNLADELGYKEAYEHWNEILKNQERKLEYFLHKNLPVSKFTCTGKIIESQSILPYMLLLAYEHLGEELKKGIINQIKKNYLGCCGIATESLNSLKYQDDGYFRGSVFPYEMLLVDSIEACGEKDLARRAVESYCNCFRNQGSYECFDSKTGVGQRECAYTSTAALFLYLFNKYMN